jgi:hypothetical protein
MTWQALSARPYAADADFARLAALGVANDDGVVGPGGLLLAPSPPTLRK